MTNLDLAKKAKKIATNYNTAYVWGSFGFVANESNMKRLLNQYSKNNNYLARAKKIYGKGFFFDCVGLIKAILWGWNGDSSHVYGGLNYASNGVPDISADQMIKECYDISNDFSDIEVGEAVWMTGHIGIYIGTGKVAEATPAWAGGVQISDISTNGRRSKNGSGSAYWKKHGKLPYIQYVTAPNPVTEDDITDISEHYAKNHIVKLIHYGIVNGYGDGTFRPDNNITRAEFSSLTATALEKIGYTLKSSRGFADMEGHWAETVVAKLAGSGIVNGFEDGTFKPDMEITRGQAAIIATNMLSYCGVEVRNGEGFPDIVSHYAEKHIKSLNAYGVVNGYTDGTFKPDNNITRGQAAMYIANCLTVLGK